MNPLRDFHFLRPAWLLLVPLAVAIWWFVRKAQDPLRGWREVIEPDLLDAMTVGRNAIASPNNSTSAGRNAVASYYLLPLTAWLLAIIGIAGPAWRPEPSPFADDPVPVMLVLRAGETMDLTDLVPSRMERARLKVTDFAAERKGQPLGLIAYAGTSHLVLPPTRDTAVVSAMAAEISPAIMPQPGDNLANALRLAARTLHDGGGSIVVVTDTVAADSESLLAEFRSESALPIHFLAIARADTPEYDAVRKAASTLRADTTLMTADDDDVRSIVRRTAKAPVMIGAVDAGTRWAESGWWVVPVLALISLTTFRQVRNLGPTAEM